MSRRKYRNLLAEFMREWKRRAKLDPSEEAQEMARYGFWAKRWKIKNEATLRRWVRGDRRIGPNNRQIFDDVMVKDFRFPNEPELRLDMDTYYRLMPPSDQSQSRSDTKRKKTKKAA